MTKSEEKKFYKWMDEVIEKYRKILLLHSYQIGYKKKDESGHYLSMEFTAPYRHSCLFYSTKFMEQVLDSDTDKDELERRVCHELFHVVTDRFYSLANARVVSDREIEDERESLVDHLANIVFNLT